jgi:hypothetical protein
MEQIGSALYKESMRTRSLLVIITSLLAAGALACSAEPRVATDGRATAGAPAAAASAHAAASTDERGTRLRGRIGERLAAGSYTYLDLRLADGSQRWIVLMGNVQAAPGEEIEVVAMGTRADFHSRRLDRTFERLVFASRPN